MKTVITTIAQPTFCVKQILNKRQSTDGLIVIGDKKGPFSYEVPNTQFYSFEKQMELEFQMVRELPVGHYSRKNLGYLLAMQQGEECIYETDDDNEPNANWQVREKHTQALIADKTEWLNVYSHFSTENIWPRGFLLNRITNPDSMPRYNGTLHALDAPIQQGLANISPDVDAIWRLTQDREFYFEEKPSIALQEGTWCPFNTQSTWWWKEAFPLMYLPSFCSFRMTDIWKSFVAQRCLWEMDYKMVFHAAEVNQNRNIHNLMKDFEAEIPGYNQNEKLTSLLEESKLHSGKENALRNLVVCYENLVKADIFPREEMRLVKAWASDVERVS
jgi:hypothetical protein